MREIRRLIVPALLLALVLPALVLPAWASLRERMQEIIDEDVVKSIVQRVETAYGGREVLGMLNSVYARGRITAFVRGDEGTYVRYFARDRKLRVDIMYSGSWERRILNGDRGYRGMSGPPVEVAGQQYLAMLYQYKRLDLPYGLSRGKYRVSYEGRERLEGVEVEVLSLSDNEGPQMKAYIDLRQGLILKVTGYFKVGDEKTSLSSVYSDFRKVQGSTFPFKIVNYAGGRKVGETVMEEYRINPRMAEKLFAP
jgi:hypothetical protein